MELLKKVSEMRAWTRDKRAQDLTIGLVPTMGFLHEGHLSLMKYCRSRCDQLITSIFVNPTQFGPSEDLEQYPRDLERDFALMKPVPVDAVFNPDPEEIYPEGFQTTVEVTEMSRLLCGQFRPIHFKGVATVVIKLFNIVNPHLAVFGEKDYQQLAVIKRMVRDLNLDVEVIGQPTVREPDGLAMSSRNVYLSPEERVSALSLSASLRHAQELADRGERDGATILRAVRQIIEDQPYTEIQYAALVDPETLTEVEFIDHRAVLALAVMVGRTRLIDNTMIKAG